MRSRLGGRLVTAAWAGGSVLAVAFGAGATLPVAAAWTCPAAPYGVHHFAPGAGKTVGLTFDDGPGPSTGAILSVLKAKHVRATFFNLGRATAGSEATVRSEVNGGDAVGNHTWDHKQLTLLSASAQAKEMERASAAQAALVGRLPCLFRPPYGSYDATTLALAQQRHLTVYTWSVDPEDWKAEGSSSSYWVTRIISRAEAGIAQTHPVILLHDQAGGNPATVAALGVIIDFYRVHGYAFVDLSGRGGYPTGSPFGSHERVSRWPGGLRVDGWAIDPNTTGDARADLYVDGRGSGRYRVNAYRPDVAKAYPGYGPDHGLSVTFPYTAAGTHRVCLIAVNVAGAGDDTVLGCRAVTVSNNPVGYVDAVTGTYGRVTLAGWALDPDTAAAIAVVPSLDGQPLAARVASGYRPDVGRAHPGWGDDHGFRFTLAVAHGPHTVCISAVNVGPGASTRLRCAPVTT